MGRRVPTNWGRFHQNFLSEFQFPPFVTGSSGRDATPLRFGYSFVTGFFGHDAVAMKFRLALISISFFCCRIFRT